jgi:putative PIN family toxin of toxin-antitoxin system
MEKPAKPRVVLDTNVLVSFLLTPHGQASAVVAAGLEGSDYQVVTCPAILEEVRRVCAYPKIARRYGISESETEALIALLKCEAIVTPGLLQVSGCEDPADDRVLACAVEGQARFIVTGDHHLLALGEYRGIRICHPAEALRLLSLE